MPRLAAFAVLLLALPDRAVADEEPAWTDLIGAKTKLDIFKGKTDGWIMAESVSVDAKNNKRLTAKPGKGVLVNGKNGRESDLITKESYGDIEVQMEFLIPKGSNSGLKFH